MAAIDELKSLLREDVRQLTQLAELLEQEKASLAGSDIKAIEPLTREKNLLLDQIRERARRKIRVLVDMGYRPESGNPSRFILSAGLRDLNELWQTADRQLKACQQLNSVNARVVNHLQKRLGRLTDIFRGTAGQQKLYGAQGQQTSVGHTTVLASA